MILTKVCKICEVEKPIKEFNCHSISSDGYYHECKACFSIKRKSNTARYYRKNKEKILAKQRINRDPVNHYRDKRKIRAQNYINGEIRAGRLEREECAICGSIETEGHHPDYDRPDWVIWYCKKHHAQHHVVVNKTKALVEQSYAN